MSCCTPKDTNLKHFFKAKQSPEYWPPPEINIMPEPKSPETPEPRSSESTEPDMSPEAPEPPEPKGSPEPDALPSSKSPEPKSPEPEMSPEIWSMSMGIRRSSSSCSRQGYVLEQLLELELHLEPYHMDWFSKNYEWWIKYDAHKKQVKELLKHI